MLVALANIMRLSLRKGAHAVLSSAAWQEIQVRASERERWAGRVRFARYPGVVLAATGK
jgi:hypothetical protein